MAEAEEQFVFGVDLDGVCADFYARMREIACGAGILLAKDKTPWVMARVAGDVLDVTTLSAGLAGMSNRKANTPA